jgi:hypothetical protein
VPDAREAIARRTFLTRSAAGLGMAALASLWGEPSATAAPNQPPSHGSLAGWPHRPVRAKRVIYLFQSGAPSQMDLFDPKPQLDGNAARIFPLPSAKGSD